MLKTLLLPPGGLFLLILLAGLLLRFSRPGGRALMTLAIVLLYLLSTPYISGVALQAVTSLTPALSAQTPEPKAIVVLGGNFYEDDDGDPPKVGALTLERLHMAAALHRRTGLPILASAGPVTDAEVPGSRIMKQVLEEDFGVPVEWIEDTSRNTWTNARDSADILKDAGVESVYLATQPWHMARAVRSFQWNGIVARPAVEIGRDRLPDFEARSLLPHPRAMTASYYAAHELAGLVWYTWMHEPEPGG